MNEWTVNRRTNNMNCGDRVTSNGCAYFLNSGEIFDCTFENCPIRVDNEPITGEWLVSVGATKTPDAHYEIVCMDSATLTWYPACGVTLVLTNFEDYEEIVEADLSLPTKTRQDFADLYFRLSGRRLGK